VAGAGEAAEDEPAEESEAPAPSAVADSKGEAKPRRRNKK